MADSNWSVKELIETAEKLLEWMPIYSKGSSGHIRQMNLRAAIDKLKAEPSADELTKFENWAKGKNLPTMPNGDVYVHVESQMAWEAWQARAKLRDVSPARGGGE